ncbi:ATP phosphoribosyltransferase [Methylocapsa acidiphila]|uniref:ATP phosphoribosyltransferase n=1 Tax=Methylocapsa acidiphila TaxID=133552 RepID=UPI00041C42CC|nr:ATP phosphoribosyltransferase [Methylocapsa acidiphila]
MSAAAERPLVLAVPSKGRLQENASAFFARAGLELLQGRGARDYRGAIVGLKNVEIAYLSASDIVAHLAAGSAHLGVTGEDLVRETLADADAKVALLTPLGFGGANVVVAVPRAWIDVKTMSDLEDVAAAFRARRGERMRVATKYVNLTRRFFAERHVSDYRIVESSGATEGAPAAGQAELIVDITTTGATLTANALKTLDDGVILRSQANLVASLNADWTPQALESARIILSRIAAEEEARLTREVSTDLASLAEPVLAEAEALFGARLRHRAGDGRLTLCCPKDHVASLADWLIARGGAHVAVAALDYVFSAANPLFEKLVVRLREPSPK